MLDPYSAMHIMHIFMFPVLEFNPDVNRTLVDCLEQLGILRFFPDSSITWDFFVYKLVFEINFTFTS